jgi:hypothetical protein
MNHAFQNISLHDSFRGKEVVLGTMHGKGQVIAPVLESIGLAVMVSDRINTDLFGTFSGDIPRPASQLETLRLKVDKCFELHHGHSLALASEGAFYPHPGNPFIVTHTEMVILKDRHSGLEVIGHHTCTNAGVRRCELREMGELDRFLEEVSFPEYGVILKGKYQGEWRVGKDFQTRDEVLRAFDELKTEVGGVTAESDLRAHRNPRRMKIIGEAARDLVAKLESRCPHCAFPGFTVTAIERGLPCEDCGASTQAVLKEISTCAFCQKSEERLFPRGMETASAGMCDYCNP